MQDQSGKEAVVKHCTNKDTFIIQYNDPFWPFPQRVEKKRSQLTVVDIQYPDAPF